MFTFSILLFHFYPHIPCGMWRIPKLKHFVLLRFLLTHPVWDVTIINAAQAVVESNFYSHIPGGMWQDSITISSTFDNFYSHIPCGMWRMTKKKWRSRNIFLLTHPVWDVTLSYTATSAAGKISTHTSRVGCDGFQGNRSSLFFNFYSHIPCGMWQYLQQSYLHNQNFYSHIPCGMWPERCRFPFYHIYFYSHIPCGMWLTTSEIIQRSKEISTHTSRVGCDAACSCVNPSKSISTHTSRVGCDRYI